MNNLHFNSITLHNFMSFAHSELSLSNVGCAIVTGQNNHVIDNAISNGSGKSSIFNGICYALTGETAQGLKDNVENIYGDPNDCWVELDVNVDNDHFVIKRIKTPHSDLKIMINGADCSGKGIKESTKLLQGYIPDLNPVFICSIIVLGQGLPSKFTEGHPGYRKEKLEKLTKSDYLIQSIREKLDNRKIELLALTRQHEDALISCNSQLDVYNKQLVDFTNELDSITSYNSEYTLDDRLVYLDNKIAKLNTDKCEIDKEIDVLKTTVLDVTNNKNTVIQVDASTREEKLKDINDLILDTNNKIIEKKTQMLSLEKEIKKLKSITDVCPTCGQKIPGAHKVDTAEKEDDLAKIKKNLITDTINYDSFIREKDRIVEDLDCKLGETLKQLNDSIEFHQNELNKKSTDASKLQQRIQKAIAEQAKVQNMKDNYDKINDTLLSVSRTIKELEGKRDKLLIDIADDRDHLKVNQDLITLTKKEFRGILLQNVIEYINKRVKQYSLRVFDTDLLSFELNDNYIDIKYDNKYYEALSGGEKQKVDIIIQLALRDLLSNRLKIHSNVLVLDEVFDNLDAVGCQRIMDLISNLDDIESTFVISHHANELQISYDAEIIVEKNNDGISSIIMR